MADNRTGLSPADIAELFRDRCGDGSMEWIYTPMQTWVLLDVADMLDENAKLREQLESIVGRSFRTADKMVCLEAENAKLRELVRDMHKWLWNGADCTECPFVAKCDLNAAFESDIHAHVCLGWSEIHRRMRELGVEV